MENKKIIVSGIYTMLIGALGYIPFIFISGYMKNRIFVKFTNLILPTICTIGFLIYLIGLLISRNISTLKLNSLKTEEVVKEILSIFFTISISIYIISLFFPYYSYNNDLTHGITHFGVWLGFLPILGSLLMLFNYKYNVLKLFSLLGSICMITGVILLSPLVLTGTMTYTFSYYLLIVTVVIIFLTTVITRKLPKTSKYKTVKKIRPKTQKRLGKLLTILGVVSSIIATGLVSITNNMVYFVDPSVWILILTITISITIILLVYGRKLQISSNTKIAGIFCPNCGKALESGVIQCPQCNQLLGN